MFHIAAHRRDDGCLGQATPINAVKAEGVVRIPEDGDLRPDTSLAEQPVEVEYGVDRVPFFSQDHCPTATLEMGQEHLLEEKRRQRSCIIVILGFFTIIDAGRMIAADPLTPTVQLELLADFIAWQVRITDKPQMRLEAALSQGPGQTADTTRNTPSTGIGVRAFEG